MGFFKKKETPEEKAARKAHEAEVEKAYQAAYDKAELEAAVERGTNAGKNAGDKKKGELLATLGGVAEGAIYGINKGADTFVKGVGNR